LSDLRFQLFLHFYHRLSVEFRIALSI
jgi:hypothetical protein